MAELAARSRSGTSSITAPTVQPQPAADEFLQKVYPALYAKAKHTVAKPGDTIAVAGLDWRIVSVGGRRSLKHAAAGRGQAESATARPSSRRIPIPTENAQSVGSHVTFGKFRVAHLGDLTWNKEFELMCPTNRIGTVDLFIVSHHGQPISNSPKCWCTRSQPRVAIMNNGTRKGGQPDAMKIIYSSPGLEDLWQMHFSLLSGQEYTVPGMFIANPVDEQPAAMPMAADAAAAAGAGRAARRLPTTGRRTGSRCRRRQDGTFTVTNARNGFSKTYKAGT